MKRALRSALVSTLFATGLLQLWARLYLRKRAVVLMYHRVLSPADRRTTWSHPAIVVSRKTFERQMQALRERFSVLSPAEFVGRLNAGRFTPGSCLVTFDDGWIDTYTEAWPVLKQQGIPALVFLPSAYIGTERVFWQERLGRLLWSIRCRATADSAFRQRAVPVLDRFDLGSIMTLDGTDVREQILDLVRARKGNGSSDPEAPVRALLDLTSDDDAAAGIDRFIDWDQAREMAAGGVTFGAHGHTHRLLTTLSAEDSAKEIEASRDLVRERVGSEPLAFCYPNGAWNAAIAGHVEAARFVMAFSTDRGPVEATAHRFALRRVNIHEDMTASPPMFLARLVGLV
jgi:peptidoglycan/xylan/chitin deacetylase (PgdA/CDA1 family)